MLGLLIWFHFNAATVHNFLCYSQEVIALLAQLILRLFSVICPGICFNWDHSYCKPWLVCFHVFNVMKLSSASFASEACCCCCRQAFMCVIGRGNDVPVSCHVVSYSGIVSPFTQQVLRVVNMDRLCIKIKGLYFAIFQCWLESYKMHMEISNKIYLVLTLIY